MRYIILLLFTLGFNHIYSQIYTGQVSVDILHQTLIKGKKLRIEAKALYDGKENKSIYHYLNPQEFYKSISSKGEIVIYIPKNNEVSYSQNSHYTNNNELLYFFVNNKTNDLGLEHEGFTMTGSRKEKQNLIYTWTAPENLKPLKEVDIVFKDGLPIFAEYRNAKDEVLKKIYYYTYYYGNYFNLPMKITEISYSSPTDSIIKRITYSNLKTGQDVNPAQFNFEIPDDAKKIK